MRNKKTAKGITLIALVITIIVLLILAGVSISMLTGRNGIINQAQNAKNKTEEAEQKEKADLEEQNALIENTVNGGSTPVKPGEKVKETAKDNYIDVNSDKATVPGGFTVSGIESEQKVADGLVIYDIPDGVTPNWDEDTNSDGVPDVQTKYNQFVWIPVNNIKDYKISNWQKWSGNIEDEPSSLNGQWIEKEDSQEYSDVKESIIKYKGFYVARYEGGKEENNDIPVSKANVNAWVNIQWGGTDTDIATDGEVGNDQEYGAVKLARNMYQNEKVKSNLIYGSQWDSIMNFLKDIENPNVNNKKYILDSTSMGWYLPEKEKNINHITGKKLNEEQSNKTRNLYDLAGNVWEWTMEIGKRTDGSSIGRTARGGGINNTGDVKMASTRITFEPQRIEEAMGFRVAIYIK